MVSNLLGEEERERFKKKKKESIFRNRRERGRER